MESSQTRVVNMHKARCDVVVDRSSIFGNPFSIPRDGTRIQVIERYRSWFFSRLADPTFYDAVENLRGLVLGCHCLPHFCHAQVIAAYLNGELSVD
jgi:hypothetical protein